MRIIYTTLATFCAAGSLCVEATNIAIPKNIREQKIFSEIPPLIFG